MSLNFPLWELGPLDPDIPTLQGHEAPVGPWGVNSDGEGEASSRSLRLPGPHVVPVLDTAPRDGHHRGAVAPGMMARHSRRTASVSARLGYAVRRP